ncbi:MAG TPA: hypothetical protein VK752_19810 [Bryobacteraceae bacterium]|jgi:hypothetical protein|nr:hypothetical protein [Bryobacteraceae bacterium]
MRAAGPSVPPTRTFVSVTPQSQAARCIIEKRTNLSLRETLTSTPTAKEGFTRVLLGPAGGIAGATCVRLPAPQRSMERAVDEEKIARFLEDNQAEVEFIFAEALHQGQRGGELSNGAEASALAKFFVGTIHGMPAMARLKSDHRALRQVARRRVDAAGWA